MDASTFAVARLTLRGTTGAGPVVRLRAANELEAANLTPAGLSPASVLVVRRLADPLPRRFGTTHRRPRPDWERAVRGALEAAARVAARPDDRGRLDASAPAVLFEDEAQAIACLVADRAHGRVALRWWWPSLLPRLNLPAGAAFGAGCDPGAILAARPREAPAVLSTIVRWQETAAIAGALSAASASIVLRSIASTHNIPAALIADWLQLAVDRPNWDAVRDGADQPDIVPAESTQTWQRWLPSVIRGSATAPEIELLLGVACGVHAAPAQLRAATVALRDEHARSPRVDRTGQRRLKKRQNNTAAETVRLDDRVEVTAAGDIRETALARVAEHASSEAVVDATTDAAVEMTPEMPDSVNAAGHPNAPRPPEPARTSRDSKTSAAVPQAGTEPPIVRPIGGVDALHDRDTRTSLPPAPAVTPHHVEPSSVPPITVPSRPNALATTGVVTRLGGLFYLIHVLERLELPHAFEPAWAIGSTAGSWGTLDLIARALLGSSFPAPDRVWEALAELAGWNDGPARAFGSRFADGASDPAWVAPLAWPAELRDQFEQVAWSHAGPRVCLWSREGYLLTHRRARGDAETAARRARRRFEPDVTGTTALVRQPAGEIPWLPPAMLPAGCPPRLGRWAAATAPAVLRRLRLALGHDTARATELLRAPARVFVTSSHVDVVFALSDIDVTVRRAGLDRNPGWRPAFGRVVYFHFQ
jgi:hypothetical protein